MMRCNKGRQREVAGNTSKLWVACNSLLRPVDNIERGPLNQRAPDKHSLSGKLTWRGHLQRQEYKWMRHIWDVLHRADSTCSALELTTRFGGTRAGKHNIHDCFTCYINTIVSHCIYLFIPSFGYFFRWPCC